METVTVIGIGTAAYSSVHEQYLVWIHCVLSLDAKVVKAVKAAGVVGVVGVVRVVRAMKAEKAEKGL